MTLKEWLEKPSHRFRWGGQGGDDCLMFCASWVEHVTGSDPVADFRGTYGTEEEAHAIVEQRGGMVALVSEMAIRAGFERTDSPEDGDIGIIIAPAGLGGSLKEIGAIKFGPLWAVIGPAGVRAKKAECIAAWRVPQ
ncbi:hypothetical protein [Rhizobium sp. RCC_161_2]|uniref:DUF6950 family protein n=1 Tax=Rhizobium sp. RCC_161_2 TaxID=3239219 RepID=UPI003524E28C